MSKEKKNKITIELDAHVISTDPLRVCVKLDDAAKGGLLGFSQMKISADLLPKGYEPAEHEITGKFVLALTMKKK